MKNLWKYLCYAALAVCLIVGTLHIFRGDLFYETDIARDMLLLQDMVKTQKISLIGGRSSMPGVFHGPLYYWLVLPVFVLAGGNPVAVSYMWLVFFLLFLLAFYLIGKKTVDAQFALISTTLMASLLVFTPAGYTHTTLANFLIMPFIFLVYRYVQTNKVLWLAAAVLTAGLLIQFQMAFGIPVLLLVGSYTIFHSIQHRKFLHLLVWGLLLIPLSTFIVFDVRHDFIQVKSAIQFVTSGEEVSSLGGYVHDRLVSITECFRVWKVEPTHLWKVTSYLVIASLIALTIKVIKDKKAKGRTALLLSLLVLFGFWVVTLPFKGNIWPQYYRTLLPVIVFCFTYFLLTYIPKHIGMTLIAVLVGSNIFLAAYEGVQYWKSIPTTDEVHWKFYRQMTKDIVADSQGKPFGYYVFSPDQYGYQGKYALSYFAKKDGASVTPYQKQALTYLVIAPNSHDNPWANEDYWQTQQVHIERAPDSTWTYSTPQALSYTIRRFDLSQAEATVSAEPTLLDGIHFR